MTGFSADWLDLREAADHRARNGRLARALSQHFGAREIAIADLGCGTGSNLRALAPLLGPTQRWMLIDDDEDMLSAAAGRLERWADGAAWEGKALALSKAEKRISVQFRRADLARDLKTALAIEVDLVAAAALLDLVSAQFIAAVASSLACRTCAFYSVLTYNGTQSWTPEGEDDAALLDAFNRHQRRDKGFGPAAGADASQLLAGALRAANYAVFEGDSAWHLGGGDAALIAELAAGFATAAAETGLIAAERVDRWRALRRAGACVGHTDVLALPE